MSIVLLAEGKGYYGEAGLRVPAIAWWPGTIKAGQVSSAVVSLMDIFPTLLDLIQVPVQAVGRHFDGQSVLDSLLGDVVTRTSNRTLLFYCNQTLVSARIARYKIYFRQSIYPNAEQLQSFVNEGGFPKVNRMTDGCPDDRLRRWLVFDVERDPGELWPISADRLDTEVVVSLNELLEMPKPPGEVRDSLLVNENLHDELGPCCNPPYCACSSAELHL